VTEGIPLEILQHYALGLEAARLFTGKNQLERARTQELLARHLPPPPAVVLDVGGGSGVYACWLAARGYTVHLLDAVPLHVEQARAASARQPDHPIATLGVGDARRLSQADASADAVLLLGPLYHLTERSDRMAALGEARRVLRPGGVLCAAAVGRFASLFDALFEELYRDPAFVAMVERDLTDGQHRNPTGRPEYFTTAVFHRADELEAEVRDAGFAAVEVVGIQGPGGFLPDFARRWADPASQQYILWAARVLEREPTLLGVSDHLLAVGRKPC
jgi:ubiquinone/menaquinone biosynthesis C-methylase UbiE